MKSFALQGFDAPGETWSLGSSDLGREPADYCSREGALALKTKIESYWRERGQEVMLSMHNVGFHPAIRAARYDVRSDMINGMPRSAIQAASATDERDSYSVSLTETEIGSDNDNDDVWIDD